MGLAGIGVMFVVIKVAGRSECKSIGHKSRIECEEVWAHDPKT